MGTSEVENVLQPAHTAASVIAQANNESRSVPFDHLSVPLRNVAAQSMPQVVHHQQWWHFTGPVRCELISLGDFDVA